MLRTITPAEMKRVENTVMAQTSITGEALMQNAAAHVAHAVKSHRRQNAGMVLCVCGTGNNGGDGLAAMRILAGEDPLFEGICWLLPGKLSQDAQRELDRLIREAGSRIPVRVLLKDEDVVLPENVDCIIDAMFGTGLSRPLEGIAAKVCKIINVHAAPIVAVDIPSGLNGETGGTAGEAVRADVTITFHRPKPGLYLQKGPEHAGTIVTADIGLNVPMAKKLDDAEGAWVLERKDLNRLLPARRRTAHKGNYGRVLLFAGSRGMAGAAAISAIAALRSGAGLVTVACPEKIVDIVQVLCPCATCLPLEEEVREAWDTLEAALEKADAIGAGCGLGQSGWAAALVDKIADWLEANDRPAVLDADALNLFSMKPFRKLGGRTFITPHPMEARRLLHTNIEDVLTDGFGTAKRLREAYGASVVLKGSCSILCAAEGCAINPFGTPGMAKGGSGDALTGIMAALLAGRAAGAYVMKDIELMQTACALHGCAGEMAAEKMGERGMLATDLCDCIGRVKGEDENQPAQNVMKAFPETIMVVVEHPAGSRDENDSPIVYRRNTGYVQQVLDEYGEWQDACLLGCKRPVDWFEGKVVASLKLEDRTVWAVGQEEKTYTLEQIAEELSFLGDIKHIEMFR